MALTQAPTPRTSRPRRVWLFPLLALVVLVSAAACGAPAAAPEEANSTGTEFDSQVASPTATAGVGDARTAPTVQSPEDAAAQDLRLAAAARGWTIEQTAADLRASEVIGRIDQQVATQRPAIFVGSVLSPEPGGPPSLYIKGPADDFIRALTANAEISINLVDNQPFSFDELEDRKLQVHHALEREGFKDISTEFDIAARGRITASVTREPGVPDDPAVILAGLPSLLRESVDLTVSDDPVAVYD